MDVEETCQIIEFKNGISSLIDLVLSNNSTIKQQMLLKIVMNTFNRHQIDINSDGTDSDNDILSDTQSNNDTFLDYEEIDNDETNNYTHVMDNRYTYNLNEDIFNDFDTNFYKNEVTCSGDEINDVTQFNSQNNTDVFDNVGSEQIDRVVFSTKVDCSSSAKDNIYNESSDSNIIFKDFVESSDYDVNETIILCV